MARITGAGEAFIGFDGGDMMSIGKTGTLVFQDAVDMPIQTHGGEYIIPKDTTKKLTQGLLDITGTFAGTFQNYYFDFWESGGPDKDGWEPRVKWDR